MDATIYKSKIDWWVPAIVAVTVAISFICPALDGEIILGTILGAFCAAFYIILFASVKYQIYDGKLGIRNFIYKWEWFPIEKISEAKKSSGILATSALSTSRVAIKFSDRSILKSTMPLEISPKDRDAFIAHLKKINPGIKQ